MDSDRTGPADPGWWTPTEVLKLAPDLSSVSAAKGLARPQMWSATGLSGHLLWGRIQGSEPQPYQVQVDLAGPRLQCSCPSRKVPCKHSVALLLMWVRSGGDLSAETDPGLDRRARAEAKARKAAEDAALAAKARPDPEAQARRRAERIDLMTAGMADFERWLADLVRDGLAAARHQGYRYWDAAAARLVDAQLPGLADQVRGTGGMVATSADWAPRLLEALGRWHLVTTAWARRDELSPEAAADLRTTVGWARRLDDVRLGERRTDRWVVAASRQTGDEQLVSRRTWLWAEGRCEFAALFDFGHGQQPLAATHRPGTVLEAELAVFPGSAPNRVAFTGDELAVEITAAVPGAVPLTEALDRMAAMAAANPWAGRLPMALAGVTVTGHGGRAQVVDDHRQALPVAPWVEPWGLLAVSGGHPVDLFGEWLDDGLVPLVVAGADGLVVL